MGDKKKKKEKVNLSASDDPDLKLKARIEAAKENKTLSAKVEELLREYTNK